MLSFHLKNNQYEFKYSMRIKVTEVIKSHFHTFSFAELSLAIVRLQEIVLQFFD